MSPPGRRERPEAVASSPMMGKARQVGRSETVSAPALAPQDNPAQKQTSFTSPQKDDIPVRSTGGKSQADDITVKFPRSGKEQFHKSVAAFIVTTEGFCLLSGNIGEVQALVQAAGRMQTGIGT